MHALLALLTSLFLISACADSTSRATQLARHSGFDARLMRGTEFEHQILANIPKPGDPLYVFVEGDGSPWVARGERVAQDATPRRPLALQLAVKTPGSVLYLGRPCYFQARIDRACRPALWTSQRYSPAIVDSMTAALNDYVAAHRPSGVWLVGFSGGGTLAVLMAPKVDSLAAVVTLGANLDPDAWTAFHHYLPLTGSSNPTRQPPLDPTIVQWHLHGDRDTVVPTAINESYWSHVQADHIWRYASFDHACCWVQQWPDILARLETADHGQRPPD